MPSARDRWGFTPREWRALRALESPVGVQRALDAMPYHLAGTAWSPRRVLRARTAHCLEGAVFAAVALAALGFRPLLLDLEAVQDTDHVVAVFRVRDGWGAIAKSNFAGLRYREPIHRSIRELALSYFEGYLNLRGDRTLRAYSRPVDLRRAGRAHPGWATSEEDLWWIPEHLLEIPHTALLTGAMIRGLSRVDGRGLRAALVGHRVAATARARRGSGGGSRRSTGTRSRARGSR